MSVGVLLALLAVACSGGSAAYYEAPPDGTNRLQLEAAAVPEAVAAAAWDNQQQQQQQQHLLRRQDAEEALAAAAAAAAQAQAEEDDGRRVKRMGMGPSLSIVNPMDVLRQRLLLEIARRRLRDAEEQIKANKDFLQQIGKRAVSTQADRSAADIATEWGSSNPRWNNQFSMHQS